MWPSSQFLCEQCAAVPAVFNPCPCLAKASYIPRATPSLPHLSPHRFWMNAERDFNEVALYYGLPSVRHRTKLYDIRL